MARFDHRGRSHLCTAGMHGGLRRHHHCGAQGKHVKAHESDVVATAAMAVDAPVGMQQKKKRQEETRSRTLVLAHLPRDAAEDEIAAAVDSAMSKPGCVHRARIVSRQGWHLRVLWVL